MQKNNTMTVPAKLTATDGVLNAVLAGKPVVSYMRWGRRRKIRFKPGDYAGAFDRAKKLLRDGTAKSVTIEI